MNIKLLLIILILFQSCISTKYVCTDKSACIEVEKQLEIISDFIFFSKGNLDSVVASGEFMESISGHISEADVQFDGKQAPTINDFNTWTSWYSVNFNDLSR